MFSWSRYKWTYESILGQEITFGLKMEFQVSRQMQGVREEEKRVQAVEKVMTKCRVRQKFSWIISVVFLIAVRYFVADKNGTQISANSYNDNSQHTHSFMNFNHYVFRGNVHSSYSGSSLLLHILNSKPMESFEAAPSWG